MNMEKKNTIIIVGIILVATILILPKLPRVSLFAITEQDILDQSQEDILPGYLQLEDYIGQTFKPSVNNLNKKIPYIIIW